MSKQSPEVEAAIAAAEIVGNLGSEALASYENYKRQVEEDRVQSADAMFSSGYVRPVDDCRFVGRRDEARHDYIAATRVVNMLIGPGTSAGEVLAAEPQQVTAVK